MMLSFERCNKECIGDVPGKWLTTMNKENEYGTVVFHLLSLKLQKKTKPHASFTLNRVTGGVYFSDLLGMHLKL